MKAYVVCLAVWAVLLGCTSEQSRIQAEIVSQEQKIVVSRTELERETRRMRGMQDSLHIKIRQDRALGMAPDQAESLERALLRSQRATVEAAGENLNRQQAYLDLLKKRLRALRGEPPAAR